MNLLRLLPVIFSFGLLAIILVAVALLTACSGLVFRGKALRKRYHLEKSAE